MGRDSLDIQDHEGEAAAAARYANAVTLKPKPKDAELGRHESADTFVPNGGAGIQVRLPDADDLKLADNVLFWVVDDAPDTWVKVGVALKDALGEHGRALWDTWSKGRDKYDANDQEAKWHSFKKSGTGFDALLQIAKEYHYEPCRKPSSERKKAEQKAAVAPGNSKELAKADFEKRLGKIQGYGGNGPDAEVDRLFRVEEYRKEVERFKPIPWVGIEPDLEEEDLIDGLVPDSGLIVAFGPPSSGKSFFVLHMALHIAAGLPYAGRETKKVPVVYIAAEGQKGFKKRVKAAREALGLKLTDDVWFSLIPVTPNLGTDSGDVGKLIDAIKLEGGQPPGLIVVDTLSRSLCGADENGPGMAKFVENCGALSESFNGVPVLPVHHTGWSEGRTRGWSGLHGATDAEFSIIEKNGARQVTTNKMKDGEDGLGWTFKLNQVEVGSNPKTGKVKTSCTVELLSDPARVERKEEPGGGTGDKTRVTRGLRVFGDALNEALTVHGKLLSLTGAGAISTAVKAVDMERVKDEFWRRWATGEKDEAKREDATRKTFKRTVEKLPSQYPTAVQGGIEYVWRLECKPK